ncbi:hypothetical protein F3Y22_tig00110931pilonHSYRG00108 [Hibiscus syriacus]|uniref:CBM20 domain-containing protein n=1 Tax=Hibiscus syriacus TaxID=106335 RepID=A0A6A2ZDX8_HIBSY|nr:hypothetical protein F3Y22_tig00110931pilonHSYRG00108 [Hibiscus syriacus]
MQVGLENIETQPEQEIPSKTVNVKFQLHKECSFGEHFFIVGDHPMLGLWDPESALPLTWSEGHVWTAELYMPVGVSIQNSFSKHAPVTFYGNRTLIGFSNPVKPIILLSFVRTGKKLKIRKS